MMGRVLSSDLLKIRRKGLWLLAVFGPFGIVALQALNFGIRYDYLTKKYADDLWGGLIENIALLVPVTVLAGVTLISSLIANVEHQTSSWKQLLALPVPRTTVFAAKFLLSVILLGLSCALLAWGTAALGVALGFGWNFPAVKILKISFLPFLASLPFLALLLWMSLTVRNQAAPVAIGLLAAVCSLFAGQLPEFVPLAWPLLAAGPPSGLRLAVGGGVLLGALILLVGAVHFERRDVD